MRRIKDLSNKRFGKLQTSNVYEIRLIGKKKTKVVYWLTKCDCGKEKFVKMSALATIKSCGCENRPPPKPQKLPNFMSHKRRLFSSYKTGAAKRDIEFRLSFDDFVSLIEKNCHYCNAPPSEKKDGYHCNGVDRTFNEAGYTLENSKPCCTLCNAQKSDSTEQDFLEHARKIITHRRLGTVRNAIITGVCGQDGSYLAEILLDKGYQVIGLNRRGSDRDPWRIKHLIGNPNFIIESADVTDAHRILSLVKEFLPTEFYHLAANSFVGDSWNLPTSTTLTNALGTINCLEAIKNGKPDCKFYNAASSEMFGAVLETPQKETTPFNPLSPYAATKVYGFDMTRIYRTSHKIFACNGILFNHESPRRSIEFVTRKISDGVARIKIAGGGELRLGNLDAKRDWGFSRDFMEAAHLMLQQATPDDYVIATGETHSIREFLEIAFSHVGLDWHKYVVQDERFMRPSDVNLLLGDSSKAREKLGWKPKYTFEQLVHEMVDADLRRHQNGVRTGE